MALTEAQQVETIGYAELRMFNEYQGHRYGERTLKDGFYLDVRVPGLRWVVVCPATQEMWFPKVTTWRAAYGLMRRMQGKASR